MKPIGLFIMSRMELFISFRVKDITKIKKAVTRLLFFVEKIQILY